MIISRMLANLLDSLPDAAVVVDERGRIVHASDRCLDVLGYGPDELNGQPVEALVPESLRVGHERTRNEYLKCPIPREMGSGLELHARRKDGRTIGVDISLSPIRSKSRRLVLAVVRDVTALRAARDRAVTAEAELLVLNAELDLRVRDRTAELDAANRELEAFSYSVSHDLRAPLRSMDGFSRILLEDHAPHLSEEAQRYLRLVRDSAIHMGRLIDDLLAFSHLGRQPLNKRTVSPANLVQEALEDLGKDQEGRRIHLSVKDLPPCEADPALLKQVFMNLLSNAIKFTRTRDAAQIEVGSFDREGAPVYYVKDNGVGFDMQYAGKLFGVFQRLHRAEEFEGTGVGLAIVHLVVSRHGGRVWAEAASDKGATFYFTLGGNDDRA